MSGKVRACGGRNTSSSVPGGIFGAAPEHDGREMQAVAESLQGRVGGCFNTLKRRWRNICRGEGADQPRKMTPEQVSYASSVQAVPGGIVGAPVSHPAASPTRDVGPILGGGGVPSHSWAGEGAAGGRSSNASAVGHKRGNIRGSCIARPRGRCLRPAVRRPPATVGHRLHRRMLHRRISSINSNRIIIIIISSSSHCRRLLPAAQWTVAAATAQAFRSPRNPAGGGGGGDPFLDMVAAAEQRDDDDAEVLQQPQELEEQEELIERAAAQIAEEEALARRRRRCAPRCSRASRRRRRR